MSIDLNTVRRIFEIRCGKPTNIVWTSSGYVQKEPSHSDTSAAATFNFMYAAFVKGYRSSEGDTNSLTILAVKQWDWVERMGWHNKLPLEYLALIASEVGEAVNECRNATPTEALGEELADIILRVVDFAQDQKIDIEAKVLAKMEKNEQQGTRGRVK